MAGGRPGLGSRIGYYIHYNRDYYLAFGLKTKSGKETDVNNEPYLALDRIHQEIINNYKTMGNWAIANQLANDLNYFFPSRGGGNYSTSSFSQEEREIIEETALEFLETKINRMDTLESQFEQLRFDYADGKDPAALVGSKGKPINATQRVGRETIKNRLSGLQKAFSNVENASGDLRARIQQLKDEEKKLERIIADAEKEGKTFISLVGDTPGKTFYKTYGQTDSSTLTKNFIEHYNSLMKDYVFMQARANGYLGEYMTLAILFALQQKVNGTLTKDVMKEFVEGIKDKDKSRFGDFALTGDVSTKKGLLQVGYEIHLDQNMAEKIGEKNEFLHYTVQGVDGGLISVDATQDKVDATIVYNDTPLNLSIKNYQTNIKGRKEVSLHQGNLLRLIQEETELINHFLNIIPSRESNGRTMKKEKTDMWKGVKEEATEKAKNTMNK